MSGLVNVTVDDTDTTVSYGGILRFPWSHIKVQSSSIHNGTLSEIMGPGNLGYGFVGSQVWLYGTVYPGAANTIPTVVSADIFLDVRVNAEPVARFTAPTVTEQQDNVLLWNSGPLQYTFYPLFINITSASDNNPFAFDYLIYSTQRASSSQPLPISPGMSQVESTSLSNALSLTPSPSTPSTQSTSSFTSVAGESSTNFSPAASQTGLSEQSPGNSTRAKPTGPIVGGVVGGIVLVAALLLFWWWKRRAHGSDAASEEDKSIHQLEDGGGIVGVTPFLLPRDHNTTSADVVQPETAGTITAGVSGIPVVEHTGKALQVREATQGVDASQHTLLAPEPNDEISGESSTPNESGDSGHATRSISTATGRAGRAGPSLSRPTRSANERGGVPDTEIPSGRVKRLPPVYTES